MRSVSTKALMALFFFSVVLFFNSLWGEFLLDDTFLIAKNPLVHDLRNIFHFFKSSYWDGTISLNNQVYRPVVNMSYVLTYALVGQNTTLYHLTNVVLHAANAVLILLVFLRWTANQRLAIFTALLFAAHPIHTEAVAAISNRTELFAAFFGLASLYFYLDAKFKLSLLAFFLALLSKESALTLLPMLLLVDLSQKRKVERKFWLGIVAAAAFYFVLRKAALGDFFVSEPIPLLDNPIAQAAVFERILTAVVVLGRYLFLLFFPYQLSPDYSFNQILVVGSPLSFEFLVSFVLYLFLVFVLWKKGRSSLKSPIVIGLVIYLSALAVTANILMPIGNIMAERFLYFPSIGFCLILAYLALFLEEKKQYVGTTMIAIISVLFSAQTIARNRDWRDEKTLFQKALETSPNSARVQFIYANALYKAGDIDGAIASYRRAIAIYPQYVLAHSNLCVGLAAKSDFAAAKASCQEALRLNPTFSKASDTLKYIESKM